MIFRNQYNILIYCSRNIYFFLIKILKKHDLFGILNIKKMINVFIVSLFILTRAVRYDDMYQIDEIKSLSFHIMFYRLFRGVAKYIVYGNNFSSFPLSDCDLYTPPTTGREGETERPARTKWWARS